MHKVVHIGVVAACVLTLAHATQTAAQTVSVQPACEEGMPEQELDEVIVTASRLETPFDQATRMATVITCEEIARAPVQSIQDLLHYAANIDVIQRGGHGVQADISIRGGTADQTAVLLNGVNLTNPHTGHYSLDIPVNLSDIERIEILHGPSALIYGSGAFSGGIHIITKKKKDSPVYAKAEVGMHSLLNAEIRGAADIGRANNSLSFGAKHSDGYMTNSNYTLYNALWQTRWVVGAGDRIDAQVGYGAKSYGASTFYSALYPQQYERTSEAIGAVSGQFGRKLIFRPQIYWTRHYDQFDLIKNSETGRNYHRGDTYGANLLFRYAGLFGTTHFGGEARREDIVSSKLGKIRYKPHDHYTKYDDRTQINAMMEHTYSWKPFVFSAGVLANYNTLQDDKIRFYPSAGATFTPLHSLRLYAAWSRSGRLPTFTDLYYTTETHNANESLHTERSESFDLGAHFRQPWLDITVVGYFMNGRDMIDWVRAPDEEKWASWNHTEVDKRGWETRVHIPLFSLNSHTSYANVPSQGIDQTAGRQRPERSASLTLNYARMYQDCDTKGLESKYTLNYLRDKFTALLHHPICGGLSADWYFRFQRRMGSYRKYEDGADKGLHPYPSFSTLDLKLCYAYEKMTFYLNLTNLYDTHYYDIGNLPQPGFWLIGGISYRY
jgi:iron complex outermembrane receptor protein